MKYIFIMPWKLNKKSIYYEMIEEFKKRIENFVPISFITADSALDEEKASYFYTKQIKNLGIEKPLCIAFDENGKQPTSVAFASMLSQFEQESEKVILFCFGTAYGLPAVLRELTRPIPLALSYLTFPHELALGVALEQIYRARCIQNNHPYHHGEKSSFIKGSKP